MHTIEFDFSLCSTVETVEENNVQVTVLNASVGPRLFNHREIDCLALDIRQQDTLCLGGSNCSVIPAKAGIHQSTFRFLNPLQMGHRLSTAETVSALIEAVLVELLQLGRGLSTAAT